MITLHELLEPGSIALLPGAIGLAAQLTWPLMRTRRGILNVQAAIGLGYGTQYALLGAWSGAAVAWLGGVQTLLILFLGAEHMRKIAFGVFPLLLGIGTLTWSGIPTLLALVASGLVMLGRLQQDTLSLRRLQLGAAPFGAAHDLYVGALPALFGALVSAAIAALALRREVLSKRMETVAPVSRSSVIGANTADREISVMVCQKGRLFASAGPGLGDT